MFPGSYQMSGKPAMNVSLKEAYDKVSAKRVSGKPVNPHYKLQANNFHELYLVLAKSV